MQKTSANNFFFYFWAVIMDLLITLEYWILLFLISYIETFQPVKYCYSRISTSRNIMFWKLYKFTLNPQFWSFQSDLFWRAISLNPYKILTWNCQDYHVLYTVTTCQILIKFWGGSCPSLENFAPFGVKYPISFS